jgi:hypothetical protein
MMPILLFLAVAGATASQPTCIRMQPVAGFEGWGHPGGSRLGVGNEAMLALKPATDVTFKPALARPAKRDTFGGYFPFDVAKAGRYRIALSDSAWIDLVHKDEKLKPAAHAHGPSCSGIAKIVGFDLDPGRYWLQLPDAKRPSIGVAVSAPSPK